MRRLVPYITLLLLALWLPATQHCAMEAVGLIERTCADDCTGPAKSTDDGCGSIESGIYKPVTGFVKITAPELLDSFYFASVMLLLPQQTVPEIMPAEAIERPDSWILTWHFVRRAAPSPRAPSLSLA